MSESVDYFTVIGSVATAVSAFAAARTLYSIKKQRQSTYKPELIIEEQDFFIYSSNNLSRKAPVEYSYESKGLGYSSDLENVNLLRLRIYNIGLGAAANIKITFEFDTINAISKINGNPSTIDKFSAIINQGRLEIKYQDDLRLSMPMNPDYLNRINYILPTNVSKDPTHISIPHYILELYSIFIYNYWHHSKVNTPDSFPTIRLKIDFTDIGGDHKCGLYDVRFEFDGGTAATIWNRLNITQKNCA